MKEQSSLLFGICHKTWAYAALLFAGLCLTTGVPSRLVAQTMLGDVTGQITDTTGAVVPGATVTFTNEGTRSKRDSVTNDTGIFRIDGLAVGTYTLEVEKAGFKKYQQTGVAVAPAQLKRVDVPLEVGAVTQTVEVHDVTPVIQTESAAVSNALPKQIYFDKPIMRMGYNEFAFDQSNWMPGSASGNADTSMMGNRPAMMTTSVEGLQVWWLFHRQPASAVSELNVILSNAPAEYARPVTEDLTYMSGNNRLSGEWREDFKNPCTYARNTPFSRIGSDYKCPTKWYHMLNVGGPVFIPKVYDGRNKTFFYFALQRDQASFDDNPATGRQPTARMQTGDFSLYPVTIMDPSTGQPFPGNIIPANRISQFASASMARYFKYNVPFGDPNNWQTDNMTRHSAGPNLTRTWMAKIDHNLGTRDVINGSYTNQIQHSAYATWTGAPAPDLALTFGRANDLSGPSVSLGETHTFSPTVVNQMRLGFTRYIYKNYMIAGDPSVPNLTPVLGAGIVAADGLQGIPPSGLGGNPSFTVVNWMQAYPNITSGTWDTRYQGFDNLSIQKGRHAIKTGFSAIKLLQDGPVTGANFGDFQFDGRFSGEPLADFLLGLPSSESRFSGRATVARRMWEYGAFLQDDFRVSPKLTFSYGVRWGEYTVPYDNNGLYYNFDPKTLSIVVPNQFAKDHVSPAWPTATFPIKLASEVGYPPKLTQAHMSFVPRFGFAYHPAKDWVLRGGYGVYTGYMRFNSLQTTGPFAITENFVNQVMPGTATGALYSMPNPFPAAAAISKVASASGYAVNYRDPYSQNWNLTLEHVISGNWGLRASYIGVKLTQAIWTQNINTPTLSTTPFTPASRPFPNFSSLTIAQNGANDRYNALNLQLTHNWSNGLYFVGSYTYSRSMTESRFGNNEIDESSYAPEYAYNRARDARRNDAYPTHDFISNFSWDLPFGAGRRYGSNANTFANGLIGGWTMSGVFSWRSGIFFSPVLSGVDPGNIGVFSNRSPNLVPGCNPTANQNVHGLWFNPACYTMPPSGQLGNVPYDSLEGPSAWVGNFSPFKDFPLNSVREGMKLRISASILNLFNHPTYGLPNRTLGSPVSGLIQGTGNARGNGSAFAGLNGMRSMVFTLKLVF